MFAYVDAVIVATPILDEDTRKQIRDVEEVSARLERARVFLGYLDRQWAHAAGAMTAYFDWPISSESLKIEMTSVASRVNRGAARVPAT
jgi:hypothetical protein